MTQETETVVAKRARLVTGRVVSDKMQKSIVVLVERKVKHPLYGKYIRQSSKLHAHDEQNEGRIGDTVTIRASRPISKSKTWVLDRVDVRAVEV